MNRSGPGENRFVSIDAGSSPVTLVTGIDGKILRVTSYVVVADAAATVAFKSAGNALTGAMSFATNGGASSGYNPDGHFETNAGEGLVIAFSANVRGHVTYKIIDSLKDKTAATS